MTKRTLKEYRVVWGIEIYATSPAEAAQKALGVLRDPESTATVFDVYRQKIDEGRLFTTTMPVRVDVGEFQQRGSATKRK